MPIGLKLIMATIIRKFWSDEDNQKLIQLEKNVILWDVGNDECNECKLSESKQMLWKNIEKKYFWRLHLIPSVC